MQLNAYVMYTIREFILNLLKIFLASAAGSLKKSLNLLYTGGQAFALLECWMGLHVMSFSSRGFASLKIQCS